MLFSPLFLMDTTFLDEIARANFLQSAMQTFGSTYICLWSYFHQPNCLLFLDGRYQEENNQSSSSSGSSARRLFDEYCQSTIFPFVECDSRVPGLAFKNGQQYIKLNESELHRLASTELQRLFYQEARIKTAVFMACKTGEIELGLSGVSPMNMEMEIRNLFRKYFSLLSPVSTHELPAGRSSSSSSSLRSLSIDSPPEYSNSLLFYIPTTSHIKETTLIDIPPLLIPSTASISSLSPTQQVMQAFAQLQNIQLPIAQETEHDAMTRAFLAVLTSPSSSSSSSQQSQQIGITTGYPVSPKVSAFKNYNLALAPTSQIRTTSLSSMHKRAISYYRRLNIARREYVAASRPASTQLHHMISERKRREKLNESFQALKSLLPPGTKKDKVSLLIGTREYLSSLKDQVDEISRRNQILEAQLLTAAKAAAAAPEEACFSSNERVEVRVTSVSESTSEWRIIDLGVTIRGECRTQELVMVILEFLKHVKNVSLISIEAHTRIGEISSSSNHVTLRLRIQGDEWEESAFKEAVRRRVADWHNNK